MSKVRVYELAKEFGLESKEVLKQLRDMGEFVKSASSTVEAPVVRKYRQAREGSGAAAQGGKPSAGPNKSSSGGGKPAPTAKPTATPGSAAASAAKPTATPGSAAASAAKPTATPGSAAASAAKPTATPGSAAASAAKPPSGDTPSSARPAGPTPGMRPAQPARPAAQKPATPGQAPAGPARPSGPAARPGQPGAGPGGAPRPPRTGGNNPFAPVQERLRGLLLVRGTTPSVAARRPRPGQHQGRCRQGHRVLAVGQPRLARCLPAQRDLAVVVPVVLAVVVPVVLAVVVPVVLAVVVPVVPAVVVPVVPAVAAVSLQDAVVLAVAAVSLQDAVVPVDPAGQVVLAADVAPVVAVEVVPLAPSASQVVGPVAGASPSVQSVKNSTICRRRPSAESGFRLGMAQSCGCPAEPRSRTLLKKLGHHQPTWSP